MRKKLKKLHSTQQWSPIRDIKDGIVVTKDGRYVQILEFAPINFLLLPPEEQDAIADAFGAAVKTFPPRFQLKILSRKADVETHVHNLLECVRQETEPKCREMQEQTIAQIQYDAVNGVSRRFFIAFPFESPGGIRRPKWEDIQSSLWFSAQQIKSHLSGEPCNNELLSTIGDSEHTLDILYNCMCRREAELKSCETKIEDVICKAIVEQGAETNREIIPPINDFIAPRLIDFTPFSHVVVDDKYYTFGYVHQASYPTHCLAGWLSALVNLGEGIDIDVFVEQVPTKDIIPKLTYSMQLTQSDYRHKSSTSADLIQVENKMESENYIRQGLTSDQSFMYFSLMISVVADDAESLRLRYKAVQNQLTAYGLTLRSFNANQDLAFRASLPLCDPPKVITRYSKRNILSGDFGSAYPFTSYEINDPRGIMVGRNNRNNSPLFLDFFDRHRYTNGNTVIYGGSGSGKTFTLQCIALRLRQHLTQTIIIAPHKGHEYRPACAAIGGTFITLAPGSPHNINIMEIRKYNTVNSELLDGVSIASSSILAAKIQQLHAFFSIIMPDMTHAQKQLIDEALIETYSKFSITLRNKSLIDPTNPSRYKQMPTLGDLNRTLEGMKKKETIEIREALSRFINGSAKSFNGPTNVNLDNNYVVIDVSNMPKELMPIAIFIATDYVYDTIRADRLRRKAIIMDELSRLIGPGGSPDAAEFVLTLYKTVRAYNTIVISATQDTNDFFAQTNGVTEGFYGKGILANAKIKLLMKQEQEEVKTLTNMLNLSDKESASLVRLEKGEGLLIANRSHVEIKVVASSIEKNLITTDPEELAKILEAAKRKKQKREEVKKPVC